MAATLTRRPKQRRPSLPTIRDLRPIVESFCVDGPALKVDEEKCVIYGVKVVGMSSPNSHGRAGVTEGTEYTEAALREAAPLYDGVCVNPNHPARRTDASRDRDVTESVGVLRNPRFDGDGIYADLHYYPDDPTARKLVHDVKNRLGGMALSHNAMPGREKVVGGKLIIESIEYVNSVDVVQKGGTNASLWESKETMKTTTFKAILENWVAKKSQSHKKFAKVLIEEDGEMMAAPMDAPPEDADPDAQLWDGFLAAIMAILNGDDDAASKAKKIGKYLKAHEKITKDPDPTPDASEPAATEEADETQADEKKDDSKKDDMKESKEVRELKAKIACLEAGVKPEPIILKSLCLLESDDERKQLIETTKAAAGAGTSTQTSRIGSGVNKPKSASPKPALTESKETKVPEGKSFVSSIRG